jgi:hypothetical protein
MLGSLTTPNQTLYFKEKTVLKTDMSLSFNNGVIDFVTHKCKVTVPRNKWSVWNSHMYILTAHYIPYKYFKKEDPIDRVDLYV